MMTFYAPGQPGIDHAEDTPCAELTSRAVWIDLYEPTREEEAAVEAALKLDVPTREEMRSIELSSRLNRRQEALYLTASVLSGAETTFPQSAAVTLVLTPACLVTVRYASLTAFRAFLTRRAAAPKEDYDTPRKVLAGLIEAVTERVADVLERVGLDLDQLSQSVFGSPLPLAGAPATARPEQARPPKRGRAQTQRRDFNALLQGLGRCSDLVSRGRETAVSFNRLIVFLRAAPELAEADLKAQLKVISADLSALGDYAGFLSSKASFLLDATLGLINNEQNAIIKVVSVAAVVFGPPTLVASIYGMNFERMPELKWPGGYPFALALMLLSAILPYGFFKRKGWL
jgi:magnesium transporter